MTVRDFDARHLWHPYDSVIQPSPALHVREAHGVRLQLEDGTELIDGMSSWWAAIHGYGHPALVSAITEQASRMSHVMFGGLTHAPAAELGERLLRLAPPTMDAIFYADSGSVAVEVALKMALQFWRGHAQPGKRRFLALRGGYHGDTAGAMAVTDRAVVGASNSLSALTLFAPRPSSRFHEPLAPQDASRLEELMRQHHTELAAIILEPIVQGAGGMWMYSPQYLQHVRQLCDELQVLLIADEIATGFGRTGRLLACEHAGVEPDILCLGKALTGGALSLAATLTSRRVAEGVCADDAKVFPHGPTFMANPLACAVASASIDELLRTNWRGRVLRIEELLREQLAPARALLGVADVRVLGAIGVVELAEPVDVQRVQGILRAHGVWLRPFKNLLYTMPPFTISDADVQRITSAMLAALAAPS